jgi:conjugative relaxase-like TrwC/TraI family protein
MVRFDRPCVSVSHAVKYFEVHMASGDYLTEEGHAEMVWVGRGAEQLGLSGQVRKEDFRKLCEGRHPVTNSRLGVIDRQVKRTCYFAQISPPKDVSVAYLVGGDERIGGWWKEAVAETVKEIESVTETRIRTGGIQDQNRNTGSMVAAMVTHEASRALDPQLHTHLCVMNTTYDRVENRWKSVQPENFYKYQGYFREVCYNKLAERMVNAGYEIEKARQTTIGFHVVGTPREAGKMFSKRREEIESVAKTIGAKSQDQLQSITARTRQAKVHVDGQTLRAQWKQEASAYLPQIEKVIRQANGTRKDHPVRTPKEAVDGAQGIVFERHSVIDERKLLAQALEVGRGDVQLAQLKNEVEQRVMTGTLIRKEEYVISRDTLKMEREYIDWSLTHKGNRPALGKVPAFDPAFTRQQREAVLKILSNRDVMAGMQGDAGSGKTRVLQPIVQGIEQAGGSVFACAPSAKATEELRQRVTPNAQTLQQLLVNKALQEQSRGKVIVVDEAGLISSRQMRDLCQIAQTHDNRVILVGDTKQHNSVQAGDAFRALQQYGQLQVVHLTEILRQKNPHLKKGVSLLADKKPYAAFHAFERVGAVKEIPDAKTLFRAAAEDYVSTVQKNQSCLVISPVWSDIHRFTDQVRPLLKKSGLLKPNEKTVQSYTSFQWEEESKRDLRNYQPGDTISFHKDAAGFSKGQYVTVEARHDDGLSVKDEASKLASFDPSRASGFDVGLSQPLAVAVGEKLLLKSNSKPNDLRNGEIVEVKGFGPDGALILKDERVIPPGFRHVIYGYATTSHADQGKSVDKGIVVMADDGLRAGNLKQAYVSHSRFERDHVTYTTDKAAAADAMATPADRKLAIEVADERIRAWNLFQKLTENAEAWELSQKLKPQVGQAPRETQKQPIKLDWTPYVSQNKTGHGIGL